MQNLSAEDQKLYDENKAAVDARYAELVQEEQNRVMDASEESGIATGFNLSPEKQAELFDQALHESTTTSHKSSVSNSTAKVSSKDTSK